MRKKLFIAFIALVIRKDLIVVRAHASDEESGSSDFEEVLSRIGPWVASSKAFRIRFIASEVSSIAPGRY